jgi:oxygen-independent coproporphyrinogen-3 oxidase
VRAARAGGIARVNLDLIYGTPGESAGDWAATLRAALAMGPDHLSAYALSIEPGTPLGRRVRAGLMPPVDPDVQAARYEVADDLLTDAGFRWYEISSWARPGAECRHNLGTWLGEPYLGIGCAAHSHLDGRRSWNLRRPEDYLAAVTAGASPEAGGVVPDPRAAAEERFALALRTRWGAVCAPAAVGEARRLAEAGLCTLVGTPDAPTVVLTRRGRLLATDVTARLCLAGAAARGRLPAPSLALDHLDC